MSEVAQAPATAAAAAASAVVPEVPPPAAAAAEETISPKLAMLARKEKAIVDRQRAFQQQQAELNKRMQDWEAKEKLWAEREARAKGDPMKALEEFGHSYQSATERALLGTDLTPADVEKRAMAKVKELEDRLEAEKKAAQESERTRAEKEAQEIVEQYKTGLVTFLDSKKDEYKLCALFDKEAELLYDTVDSYYQKTLAEATERGDKNPAGKILSNEEAAALVEKYFKKLVDDANGVLTPKQQAAAEEALDKEPTGQQVKAISNGMQQTAPSYLPAKTEEDRMRRAMAALDKKA